MPTNIGQQIVGTGVNMGIGRGLVAAGVRSPIPIPSFYNAGSAHPWRDSQAVRMAHGDRRALKGYGRRVAASAIDGALMATPVGWANQGVKFIGNLTGHKWGLGNWIVDGVGDHVPNTSVSVGDINTTGDGPETYNAVVDQATGQVSYMPVFSNYGPYSGGYKGLDSSQTDSTNWDVSYTPESDVPEYEGPYSPEHYGMSGPMPSFNGNQFGYSQAGGGYGAGVWNGGGGMHSYQVSSGSLSPSNYGGIGGGGVLRGRGKENGESKQ